MVDVSLIQLKPPLVEEALLCKECIQVDIGYNSRFLQREIASSASSSK